MPSPADKDEHARSSTASSPVFLQHFIASSLAGGVARLLTHPFDTIRTRLQVYHHNAPAFMSNAIDIHLPIASPSPSPSPSPSSSLRFPMKTTFTTGKNILLKEGLASLYGGIGIVLAVGAPALGTYLFTYDQAKAYFSSKLNDKSDTLQRGKEGLLTHLLAAVTAEVVSGLFWTPMEVIKQRMQAAGGEDRRYKSSRHAIRSILAREGWRGMYRGYFTTLGVFVPHSAIFFTSFEQMRLLVLDRISKRDGSAGGKENSALPFSYLLGISFCASAAAAAITNPLDIIKTRWQVQIEEVATPANSGAKKAATPWLGLAYKSPLDVALRIVREEGLGALTNGMVARVLWLAPSTAISMASYEMLKAIL